VASRPLSPTGAAVAFLVVASGSIVLALPRVLAGWPLWRDAVEYAATAWNLANGRGLVNPLVWTSYLAGLHPPVPALAVRPVVPSVLLAAPLALGASLMQLRVVHVVWAGLVGASGVWVARRAATGAAAVAFAVAVSWSYAWVLASQQLMSEATASGVVLLAMALHRGAQGSHARAVALAFAVYLGWLARPNLGVLAAAVPLAAALEVGWRRALRTRSLWTFASSFAALVGGTVVAYRALTGMVPYAQYGVMFEVVDFRALRQYHADYPGWRGLLMEHGPEVAATFANNASMLAQEFFVGGAYLHLGWLATPALVYSIWCRRSDPHYAFALCAGLLLIASALFVTVGFSPLRYPLPGAVCLWFLACAAMGDLARAVRRRYAARAPRWPRLVARAAPALPLVTVLALAVADDWAGWWLTGPSQWRAYRRSLERPPRPLGEPALRALCQSVDRNAVVASPDPWAFYVACGTAGVKLPEDLEDPAWADRFLSEVPLGYVVLNDRSDLRVLHASPRLRRLASRGRNVLYEVKDPLPRSRPWAAPPRLADAGRPRAARVGPGARASTTPPRQDLILTADRKPGDEGLERAERGQAPGEDEQVIRPQHGEP
jgi:hypothetical protein